MNIRLPISLFTLATTALAAPGIAAATEVFRWVDEDGTVHYSDARPANDEMPVTTLELEERTSTYDATEDPYSILNQASRANERWLQLMAEQAERAERRAPNVIYVPDSARRAGSSYGNYRPILYPPVLPPGRPGVDPSAIARQQAEALSTLDLIGNRPASINSGAHSDRVERSQFLPLVPPPPAPTPLPSGPVR